MTTHKLKGLVIILDGLGDRPQKKLSGLTPLEHASTPGLDMLATSGQSGLMDPLLPGLPVDTHTGVGILFGLPPADAINLCRGPIEAAGIDLDLQVGDLLFRANLTTIEKTNSGYKIHDRRAGRINDDVSLLCHSLQDIDVGNGISASLYPATQHRCVLRLRGPRLSSNICDTDPGGKRIESGILECKANSTSDSDDDSNNNSEARQTAEAVNRFTDISHHILENHPVNIKRIKNNLPAANGVITRGVGSYQDFNNLLGYLKLSVLVIAGESTIIGLGKLFNFSTFTDERFTALADTDVEYKLEKAIESLNTHDLVFVHIKATDTTAHDKNPEAKSDFIAKFDRALKKQALDNIVVGICADHSTDSLRGEHNGDPVPVIIYNPVGRQDQVVKFNEIDCANGALGRLTAHGYLISVLDAMGQLGNYKPSEVEFFRI